MNNLTMGICIIQNTVKSKKKKECEILNFRNIYVLKITEYEKNNKKSIGKEKCSS